MPPEDLEERWRKRKHIFFDQEQAYWLQVLESHPESMDVDSTTGRTIQKIHFQNGSPWKLFKIIQSEFNPIEKTTFRLKDGSFNFQVYKSEADLCKTIKKLGELDIQVIDHPFKNKCRGSVFSFETIKLSEQELLTELEAQGVTKVVKRQKGSDPNTREYTGQLTLTFRCDPMFKPKEVRCGYINMKVEDYAPRPLQCHKCFLYGKHLSNECNNPRRCGWCSKEYYLENDNDKCQEEKMCVNCKKDHPAWSRECGALKRELQILTLKEEKNISYKAASKIVDTKPRSNIVHEVTVTNDKVWEEKLQKNNEMWEAKLAKLAENFNNQLANLIETISNQVIHKVTDQISNLVVKKFFDLVPSSVPGFQPASFPPVKMQPVIVNDLVQTHQNGLSTPAREYKQSMTAYNGHSEEEDKISADDESEDSESETTDLGQVQVGVESNAENYRKATAGSTTGVSEMVVKHTKRNLQKRQAKSKQRKKKKT